MTQEAETAAPGASRAAAEDTYATGRRETVSDDTAKVKARHPSAAFLSAFVGDPRTRPWALTSIAPDRTVQTRSFDTEQAAVDWIESKTLNGANVYFNPAMPKGRLWQKASKNDIASTRWLWADADPVKLQPGQAASMNAADCRAHYEKERGAILAAVAGLSPPPTVVIDSGNGYQCFWQLDSALTDQGAIERKNLALINQFGDRADVTTRNVDRIMRLPGTTNFPNDVKKKAGITWSSPAAVVEDLCRWDVAYSAGDFREEPLPDEQQPKAASPAPTFDFENLPAIADLDSIPALRSEQALRYLIEHGHNPNMTPAFKSRSEALLSAARRMHTAGVDPATIAAILLDRRFAISESVIAKGKGAKAYALKQVEKVLATPSKEAAKQIPAGGIQTYNRKMKDITADAAAALVRRNGDAPCMFMFGGSMARISGGKIEPLDDDKVAHELGRAADWFTMSGKNVRACLPPRGIVNDILAMKSEDNPLPQLESISIVPLVRADGSICQDDGYDAASKTYFVGLGGLDLRPVPAQPTADDISTAKQVICEELLGDFRFVSDGDRAAAVACMLTGFARPMISGPTPPFMFEKPKERTGATLLVSVIAYPMLGRFESGGTWPTREEDHEKMLLSKLIEGAQYFMYDNVKIYMKSASFCSATTADIYEGRLLGVSKMLRPRVRCTWTLTANNPAMDAEVAKRMVRVRIDSKMTNPEERTDFRHPNLKQWATDHRGDLIWAALTLIRGWKTGGAVKGTTTLGMYESWVEVIGGILDHAGIPGLLTNRREFLKRAAPDDDAMKVFVARWWNAFGNKTVKTGTLLNMIDEMQVPLTVGGDTEKARTQSLGRKLQMSEDSPFQFMTDRDITLGITLIKAGKEHNTGVWRLQVTEPVGFEPQGMGESPGKVPFDDPEY